MHKSLEVASDSVVTIDHTVCTVTSLDFTSKVTYKFYKRHLDER